MSAGSVAGAIAGGYLAAWAPTDLLRIVLSGVLIVSAAKLLWTRQSHSPIALRGSAIRSAVV